MEARNYIKDYVQSADKVISDFFAQKIKEVGDIGEGGKGVLIAVNMLKRYEKFSEGGKKLRGSLIQLGYEITGGAKKDVLEASTCIEIIHSFLLMHDDIQDMDEIRRKYPTIHKQYENEKEINIKSTDFSHYGVSMGINMGDLGAYLGMEVLLGSRLNSENKLKAAIYLSRLLQRVAFGQGLDITYENMEGISEHDVLQVHLHKTSIYTIGGPLKIGALLGGADNKIIEAIEKYGKPVGIAFQLRDDELGLFSDEETLGKPIGGDIKEGKNTVLHIKALEFAKKEDKKFLEYAYGNRKINKKDIKKVCDITIQCGAFEYSQELSKKLVAEGKKYVPEITSDIDLQETLFNMADYMISREN